MTSFQSTACFNPLLYVLLGSSIIVSVFLDP